MSGENRIAVGEITIGNKRGKALEAELAEELVNETMDETGCEKEND